MTFVETGRFIETKTGVEFGVNFHHSDKTILVFRVEDETCLSDQRRVTVDLAPDEAREVARMLMDYADRVEKAR